MGQGSREHDLVGDFIMILVTRSLVTVEKVESTGGGGGGESLGRCVGTSEK